MSIDSRTDAIVSLCESGRVARSDKATREVIVDIIEAGMGNARDRRMYPAEVLAKSAKVFEGARMFADHLTPDMEKRLSGLPRSIRDLTGRIKEAWWNPNGGKHGRGAIQGRVSVSAPWLWEMIEHDPDLLELSINAVGKTRFADGEDGSPVSLVEAITRCHSLDWVAQAGAGGRVLELVEAAFRNESAEASDMPIDWSKVTLDELRENAPALVERIEAEQLAQIKADLEELEKVIAEELAAQGEIDDESGDDEDDEHEPVASAEPPEEYTGDQSDDETDDDETDDDDEPVDDDDHAVTEGYYSRDQVKSILREALLEQREQFRSERIKQERILANREIAGEMIRAAGFPSISERKLLEAFKQFDGPESTLRESVRAAIADKRAELREATGRGIKGAGRSIPAGKTESKLANAHSELMAELDLGNED
jgi:hypothetical protein